MYAPTVNSYKRFVSGSWASTSVSWGRDNRTTALRVIPGGAESSRLETRVPGADANPYLSMAAALGSGLYGIENKLTLDVPETQGNEYQNTESKSLPANLKRCSIPNEIFRTWQKSCLARRLLIILFTRENGNGSSFRSA